MKVCTFVTPEVADELELTLIHAIVDLLEPLRLKTGDVIVSDSFEDLVKLAVEARSGSTPRRIRPGLKETQEILRLSSSGYELGKKREFVGANFDRGASCIDADVRNSFGWGDDPGSS